MNDIFIARRSEIEAEAKRLGITPVDLIDKLGEVVRKARHDELPMTMRAIPKTMRSQFGPVA